MIFLLPKKLQERLLVMGRFGCRRLRPTSFMMWPVGRASILRTPSKMLVV